MNDGDDVLALLKYYSAGQVDSILLRKANDILGRCKPETRERAIDWITENVPRMDGKYPHLLSVTDIRDAVAEFGEVASEYIPARELVCDLCGTTFQYVQVASYNDRRTKNIHDKCPRCGFQPCWTFQAHAEASRCKGEIPKNYLTYKDAWKKSWKGDPLNGRKMFDPEEDRAYEEKQRREEMENMKKSSGEFVFA
jgi:hypothetical protein